MQLFLDCDGVLADFDAHAAEIFGMSSRQAEQQMGSARFWQALRDSPDFYYHLPLMPDAMQLFRAVEHLNPIILTGCPAGGWAEDQKLRWATKYFPGTPIICCRSAEKRAHMQPGDILVDDWTQHQSRWEEAGGIFLVHTSAADSLRQLSQLGVLQAPATEVLRP